MVKRNNSRKLTSKPNQAAAVNFASQDANGRMLGTEATTSMSSAESPPVSNIKTNDLKKKPLIKVEVSIIYGSLTQVPSPIAVAPKYQGVALAGAASDFDRKLDSWLTRAVEVGIVGSVLGQVVLLPLRNLHNRRAILAENLFLVGMGEPSTFAEDDLRFLISNVVIAVYALGYDHLSIPLIGSRRKELPLDQAVRGLLAGIQDGEAVFRSMLEGVKVEREIYEHLLIRPLQVSVVDETSSLHVAEIERVFKAVAGEMGSANFQVLVQRGADVQLESKPEALARDVDPDRPVTLLRVTKKVGKSGSSFDAAGVAPAGVDLSPPEVDIFEYSALGDQAVMTVRQLEVSSYFLRELPKRMSGAATGPVQEDLGLFFLNYLLPDDLRKFVESAVQLSVIVDISTACYPWEMAAYKNHNQTCWLGTNLNLSRRFYTVHSNAPGSPPPINRAIRVLVIADPAPGELSLPMARDEGIAVVQALQAAQRVWGNQCDIKAWVRIGSYREPDRVAETIEQLQRQTEIVQSVQVCDPIELVTLIVNHSFDVIHFAGHGMFDDVRDRAGWIFDRGCLLTAREILRVRQVPRLVFANACFSSVTKNRDEQRQQVVGLAQAFFARGVQNYIGTGWTVDDTLASRFANAFYRRVLGMNLSAGDTAKWIPTAPPATIGEALSFARSSIQNAGGTTWGAYQHYGKPNEKLLAIANLPPDTVISEQSNGAKDMSSPPAAVAAVATDGATLCVHSQATSRSGFHRIKRKLMSTGTNDPNKVYVNGINPETGAYAVPPISIEDLSRQILSNSRQDDATVLEHAHAQRFSPFDVNLEDLSQAGWGIVFATGTPHAIREAFKPLIEHRRQLAGELVKELEYKTGEQIRDWYRRYNIAIGSPEPQLVPYYLLLVGHPDSIPFEFQYLLGVEYAVGRVALATAEDYGQYVKSVIDYETTTKLKSKKKIVYWGTSHPNDPATNLSSSLLVSPLANGIPGTTGSLSKPLHQIVGYDADVYLEDQATRVQLIEALSAEAAPAVVFTASHGMALPPENTMQTKAQGGLLCQDWPGFGPVKPEHYLSGADIPETANVHGIIAVLFACFSAGTPDRDQFLMNLSTPDAGAPPAKQPFMSALPERLLSHPRGGALAVIGHIDRAWGYSIQPTKSIGSHIGPFRNGLGDILSGKPVGLTISRQFGQWFSALSVVLSNAISPTAPPSAKLDDRTLVTNWLERNDAQNYVLLGDPAARIRVDALSTQGQ